MNEFLEIIVLHATRTLPDSISDRKRLLRAIEKLLVESHPAVASIRAQLASIAAIEKLQEELPLQFGS